MQLKNDLLGSPLQRVIDKVKILMPRSSKLLNLRQLTLKCLQRNHMPGTPEGKKSNTLAKKRRGYLSDTVDSNYYSICSKFILVSPTGGSENI